jgi:hypothetical protein
MPPGGATIQSNSERDVAYCRAARRVRAAHARRPGRLYRELQLLGERHTAARPPVAPLPYASRSRAEAFSREVEARMEGPVLRHAERRRLFAAARRLGIGRFEANLVMAAVQHEVTRGGRGVRPEAAAPGRAWRLAPVAAALAVQALIAWGVWHVFG